MDGQAIKGVMLIDVIAQVRAFPDAKSFLVHIDSPGGSVEDGDQIYEYLTSLKKVGQVNTITAGNVGSIATKLFLAGDKRFIHENHKFFIHNPWTSGPGDAKQKLIEAEALKQTENQLRTFYEQATKIDAVGLASLMDNETEMTADQAVQLGFATEKVKARAKAMAFINNSTMQENNNKVLAALDKVTAMLEKAFTPAPSQVKSLVLELQGGGSVFAETEDAAALEGVSVFQVDEQGNATTNPAPDGDHTLADGRVLTVAGGKVTAVSAAAPAGEPSSDAAIAEKLSALTAAVEKITQAQANALKQPKADPKIVALEKEIKDMKDQMSSVKVPISGLAGHVSPVQTKKSPVQAYLEKAKAK